MVPESKASPEVLATQIQSVLDNPTAAMQMAAAAARFGRPEATEMLAQMVEGLAEQGQGT